MGAMKFNEKWWIKRHGMFGAHEKGSLLRAHTPLSKITLQGNHKSTNPSTQD